MKLSIIIPYYKTYELTAKLLDCLVKQLTEETEVYLVDDGCNETRLDVYSDDIHILHLEENCGATHCMNIAINKSEGKYIAIIDSDDLITEDYVETLLKTIDERTEDVIYFDWQDMNTGEIVHHPHNYAPWKAIYKKSIMPLFREGWRYSYDVPFQEDLWNIKHTEYYIDKVLYYYNSNREGSLTIEKEKVRRKNMVKCEVIEEFTLGDFDKLQNIQRKRIDTHGRLYKGDIFECDKNMADYLTGNNQANKTVVKIIEVAKEETTEKEAKVVEDLENAQEIMEKPKKTRKAKK